jgi:CubicO group peptidase (beta-lactamase class C family)
MAWLILVSKTGLGTRKNLFSVTSHPGPVLLSNHHQMFQMPARKALAACVALAVALITIGLAGCAALPPKPLPPVIVAPPPPPPPKPPVPEIEAWRFAGIDLAARQEIAAGHVPGAVILVGHRGRIVYRKAFGLRAVTPSARLMRVDTVFDLASLTKVVATATAIMRLVDQGQINLDKPAATYWPALPPTARGGSPSGNS